jgi:hypothetical protein
MREFYYYNGDPDPTFSVPFTLGAVKPGTTFELKARFLGGWKFINERNVQVEIVNSKGTTRLNDAVVPRARVVYYTSGLLGTDVLVEGFNTFRIQPVGRGTLEALLDWFTIEYQSPYRAMGDKLDFNTGSLTGNQNLTVTGLSRTDVVLFDVTNPLAPEECLLDASHFTDVGGGEFALSFQVDITSRRRFILVPLDEIEDVAGVIEDQSSNLIGNPLYENGVDILVVSHKDFLSGIQRWVDYRRAQGYRVLLADVDDVFDEFNGGVNNARAIRDFVQHFFINGGAGFLFLIGDASEDNKRVHIESGINFVPTESFSEHVSSPVFNEDEVVTTDKWYGMLGADIVYDSAPFPADFYPDVIVGRLPAGTVQELDIVIDKTLKFEKPNASDFWRRRMIRCADDAWSGLGTSCLNPPEVGFETAEEVAANTTDESISGGYDIVRFYLSNRISHPPGGCVSSFSQTQLTRMEATPALLGELAKGATILSFQAHMNRYQICHEYLFTSSTTLGQPDYLSVTNTGRPWVVFGMGCHISDFALHKELIRNFQNGPTGDCLSELLLHLDDKGAINTYGSTGFEYLAENKNYTAIIADVFFTDPPSGPTLPSNRSQVRWIMGELMATSEIENILKHPFGSGLGALGQAKRYHLLGDPLLRLDAGPPRFEVKVDGKKVESGDKVLPASGDSVRVWGVITDEVAIEDVSLEIAGVDATNQMTITPTRDAGLDAARQYEVSFTTQILPKEYDIIIRAHQAADTTANEYHMVAEFVLKVEINLSLKINGRPVIDGDLVPADGDYLFELELPVVVDQDSILVRIDGSAVTPLHFSHPTPQDSTTWLIDFSASLAPGAHTISIFAGGTAFDYSVSVGSQAGVRDLIAYPNPFQDETYFVYSNDLEIEGGAIDIFTASGKKVAHLDLPTSARAVGQNAVRWDGTTWNGGQVANGVYLYVVSIDQRGQTTTQRGKLVRVR